MSKLFDLSGKTALVTGANTGIGQGIAIGLAEAGANIVAVGRTKPVETEVNIKALGQKFTAIEADLSSIDRVNDIVRQAEAEVGVVDILVNNCLLYTSPSPRDQRGSRMPSSA